MTGAEALQQILDTVNGLKSTVDELKGSIQIIEAQIKVLNNRAAGLMKDTVSPVVNRLNASAGVPFSAGPPMQPKQPQVIQAAPSRGRQLAEAPETERDEARNFIRDANDTPGVLTYKKVFGRLINNTSEPIEGVLVKVYDKNNEVCASAETDPIGYWETMLKPGRYVAEYLKTGFKTTNKTFDVGKNSKDVEVK